MERDDRDSNYIGPIKGRLSQDCGHQYDVQHNQDQFQTVSSGPKSLPKYHRGQEQGRVQRWRTQYFSCEGRLSTMGPIVFHWIKE